MIADPTAAATRKGSKSETWERVENAQITAFLNTVWQHNQSKISFYGFPSLWYYVC